MILSFNKKFKEPIETGTKIHTIRLDKPNRWRAGKTIHFATGIRTKNYDNFKVGRCMSFQYITISYREAEINPRLVPEWIIHDIPQVIGNDVLTPVINVGENDLSVGKVVSIVGENNGVLFVVDSTLRFASVAVDERLLTYEEIIWLAKNDGFANVNDFFKWFSSDFSGKIIHWTNFKY